MWFKKKSYVWNSVDTSNNYVIFGKNIVPFVVYNDIIEQKTQRYGKENVVYEQSYMNMKFKERIYGI